MESWYNYIHWTDEAHQHFYKNFRNVSTEEQSKALLHQAHLLTQSDDDTDLKFAEALLIQWMAIFRKTEERKKAYSILADIYKQLGLLDKMQHFKRLIADL